jgi:glycosyltransferase involved in cell wall biosynthesis
MNAQPLVSCIMPTADRRCFVPQAIRCFQAQDYPNKELIILDDGADSIMDLIPNDPQIHYTRLVHKQTVGAKRNLACESARGEIIAHWDDDDWHAPHRLSYQVASLTQGASEVCGANRLYFYNIDTGSAWQYIYPESQRLWLAGGTLCYRRAFWLAHRFADVNVGEDTRFVWSTPVDRLLLLPDASWYVAIIHRHNVSPKRTTGSYWRVLPSEHIEQLMGSDWSFYSLKNAHHTQPALAREERQPAPMIRNVFACLVHESQQCVVDLVRNLQHLDPESVILLYNGGNDPDLLSHPFPSTRHQPIIFPSPKRQVWGQLHHFALDCMRFATDHLAFDTITIVDSDQLAVRPNYSHYLASFLAQHPNAGLLGNAPERQLPDTHAGPAKAALAELPLWQPYLRRFANGEAHFVYWTFWPSTVFTAGAARALTELFAQDEQLQWILARSKIWATEEVIFPTLVALLGFQVCANPCSYKWVKYRAAYNTRQIDLALTQSDVFWIHPVPRRYEDPVRKHIRQLFNHYDNGVSPGAIMSPTNNSHDTELLLTLPILARMRQVEGWLEEDEADALIAVTQRALTTLPDTPVVVEIGSYCGRSTIVLGSVSKHIPGSKVYAIDPHDGKVGALDQGIRTLEPSLAKFKRNIAQANLETAVELIQAPSFEVEWTKPIAILLIDGLHDYTNVARDFYHFESHVASGGFVAFHDYADYYPGVKALVHEVLRSGKYRTVHCVRSLMVIQRLPVGNALNPV